jgi:glycosyltransferase involved in cell wall biosynthesis
MTEPPDVSVVICSYDPERWDDLLGAVGSVRAQTAQPLEIILVVDRNDALRRRVAGRFPDLRVVANARQGGISGARNTGTDHARGEIVVFLDDDAIAEADWLERLLVAYDDDAVLGVGGQILPLWRFGRPRWFPAEFDWVVGCSYVGLPEDRARVRNPIGAALSARRTVLRELGGFDHSMGRVSAADHTEVTGTADETELCIRATKRWPERFWLYEPGARVHHIVPRPRMSWRFFVGRCQMEGTAKALLTDIAGTGQSLASEQRYVRVTLPLGVARELRSAVRGDPWGLARAGTIVAGTAITAAAYVRGRVALRRRSPTSAPASPSGPTDPERFLGSG